MGKEKGGRKEEDKEEVEEREENKWKSSLQQKNTMMRIRKYLI